MKIMHQKGFTLIELLVAIAILAIITSMAAPAFADMRVTQNLNRSVQELITNLNTARSKAALERREVTVVLAPAQTTSLSANAADTLNWMPSGSSTLTSTTRRVTYNLQGGIKDAVGDTSFTICSNGTGSVSKTVTVSMMGAIQMIVEGTC